jgi:flagellar protein FliL
MGDILTEDLLEEMDGEMADASLGTGQVSSPEPSGKKLILKRLLANKKRLVIVLSAGVVLIGILAGGWFFFLKGDSQEPLVPNEISATSQGGEAVGNEAGLSDMTEAIVFEDIIVLAPFERIRLKAGSAMGLISLNISLELMDSTYKKQVFSVQERIRKMIQGQVQEMRWLELRNPEGKIHLKYELLKRINSIFPKVMVRNIYFTNLIML